MNIPSYPSIYYFGHPAVKDIFTDYNICVQEKYDASQLSLIKQGNELYFRSKRAQIYTENATSLFAPAIAELIKRKELFQEGFIYREAGHA